MLAAGSRVQVSEMNSDHNVHAGSRASLLEGGAGTSIPAAKAVIFCLYHSHAFVLYFAPMAREPMFYKWLGSFTSVLDVRIHSEMK